jgi:hypothetical protein
MFTRETKSLLEGAGRPELRHTSITMSDHDDELDVPDNGVGVDAARHVKQVLEAAERAAEAVRNQAEEEARKYLDDYRSRVDKLDEERARISESLVDQASKMREQYSRFLETLDGALSKAKATGADAGVIERLRSERDAARDLQEEEFEVTDEPREGRRRWPIDPRSRKRESAPAPAEEPRPTRDPRPAREEGGDEGTLPGGFKPRPRTRDE